MSILNPYYGTHLTFWWIKANHQERNTLKKNYRDKKTQYKWITAINKLTKTEPEIAVVDLKTRDSWPSARRGGNFILSVSDQSQWGVYRQSGRIYTLRPNCILVIGFHPRLECNEKIISVTANFIHISFQSLQCLLLLLLFFETWVNHQHQKTSHH